MTQKSSFDKSEASEDEDLPIIPDLEVRNQYFSECQFKPTFPQDVEREDMAQRVADAPNVAVNRVDTYRELDSDLFKHAAFATLRRST